jgi:hypothetical protein
VHGAILGISLCGYLYLTLAKMLCLSYYCLCFLFNKIREQEDRTGSAWKWGKPVGGGGGGPMYTHLSKCRTIKKLIETFHCQVQPGIVLP